MRVWQAPVVFYTTSLIVEGPTLTGLGALGCRMFGITGSHIPWLSNVGSRRVVVVFIWVKLSLGSACEYQAWYQLLEELKASMRRIKKTPAGNLNHHLAGSSTS